MKILKMAAMAAATLLGVAVTSSAPAGPLLVEHYGRTFAVSVCGRASPIGSAHCYAKVVTDGRGNILRGEPAAMSRRSTPSGLSPADLWSAYAITPTKGSPGTGPTIAIVDAYGYPTAESDLAVYRQQFGLGACTSASGCFKVVNQTGGTSAPRTDIGWSQEQALDLDMASAMCPNCKILLVQATNSSLSNLAAAVNTAARLGAVVISNSYGGSESGTTSYEKAYDHPKVAVTVSSGDNGYGVEFPASSPHVIAVGGTALVRSGTGWNETAWTSAGSGCSSSYGILASTQTSGTTGCPNRAVSDVSAVADPNTGVAVYGPVNRASRGWMVFGGTSVSAPLIGGIYGFVNNMSSANLSYPATRLYANAGSLRDITSGSNGTCSTAQWCNARTGWDGPTGLGSPKGTNAF